MNDAPKPRGEAGASKAIRLAGSTPAGAANDGPVYIDSETGAQVSEDWWPGDPIAQSAD